MVPIKRLFGLAFASLLVFPSPTLAANGFKVNETHDWQRVTSSKSRLPIDYLVTSMTTDENFIEDFSKTARTITDDPNITLMLISDFNKRPDLHIRNAQNLCNAKRGGYIQKLKHVNANSIAKAANPIIRELLTKNEAIDELLAPKYYCPEFSEI